jgi:dienelactone hydrolase
MLRRHALVLALVALAPVARAQDDGFTVRLGDREIGREAVTRDAGTTASRAELRVLAEGPPFTFEQTTELDASGRFARYSITSASHALVAEVTSSGVTLRGTLTGQPVDKTLQGAGPWLVLDNLVVAHYDLLGRAMLGQDGEVSFRAVVPQALTAVQATCRPAPAAEPVRVRGVARPARALAVTLANVLVEVVVDAETGDAYRVRVPSQGLEAVRDGVDEVQGPPGAAGPTTAPPRRAPCRELEVTFPSPYGDVPGVLALPKEGEGPWPAVVFLHGSGPNDRDETIGPNKPLRDLAWQLAARGVASLRYDKRTFLLVEALRRPDTTDERRAELYAALRSMTLETEAIEDGVAAVRWLAARPEVRPDALVVAGHSLGGLAAPHVARGAPDLVRGVAVLAGAGRRFDALLLEQLTFQSTLRGLSPEEAAAAARDTLAPLADGAKGLAQEGMFLGASGTYWRDLLARDPAADLAGLDLPLLLLQGAKDCQVSAAADHEALKAAVANRPAGRVTTRVFPDLNHLFMRVEGRSTGAEYAVPGEVAAEVGEALGAWVVEVGRGEQGNH